MELSQLLRFGTGKRRTSVLLALAALAIVALSFPLQAAPRKPPSAAHLEALSLFHKAWDGEGDEQAFKRLREKADAGDAMAQNCVGNFYAEGKFVTKDEAAALQWWTKAAEQGLAAAQYNVSQAYMRAMKHEKDFVTIRKWLLLAAEQGFMDAQLDLAVTYTMERTTWNDLVQAFKWFAVGAANALAQEPEGKNDNYVVFAHSSINNFGNKMSKEQLAEAQDLASAWLREYGIDRDRELRDLDAFTARLEARKP
jgi:TPR repeat protein